MTDEEAGEDEDEEDELVGDEIVGDEELSVAAVPVLAVGLELATCSLMLSITVVEFFRELL